MNCRNRYVTHAHISNVLLRNIGYVVDADGIFYIRQSSLLTKWWKEVECIDMSSLLVLMHVSMQALSYIGFTTPTAINSMLFTWALIWQKSQLKTMLFLSFTQIEKIEHLKSRIMRNVFLKFCLDSVRLLTTNRWVSVEELVQFYGNTAVSLVE